MTTPIATNDSQELNALEQEVSSFFDDIRNEYETIPAEEIPETLGELYNLNKTGYRETLETIKNEINKNVDVVAHPKLKGKVEDFNKAINMKLNNTASLDEFFKSENKKDMNFPLRWQVLYKQVLSRMEKSDFLFPHPKLFLDKLDQILKNNPNKNLILNQIFSSLYNRKLNNESSLLVYFTMNNMIKFAKPKKDEEGNEIPMDIKDFVSPEIFAEFETKYKHIYRV
jgi:hypothetical protein